jgi:hypothetical protein
VFDNRALRNVFGPTKEEETIECRRLHNKEIHDRYFTANILVEKP